jgi:hypothetical protein
VTALRDHIRRLYPGRDILAIEPLAPDTGATADASKKASGYGRPVRIVLAPEAPGRAPLELVWHVATSNEFGHDRRADRAAAALQAFDDFRQMPRHVQPVDLGMIAPDGRLTSIRDGDEMYLITTYAPGTIYADDLRRIATAGIATERDLARLDSLVAHLVALHQPLREPGPRYRRAIRDLIGSGEGIFGIVDGYPTDVAGASAVRLREIEERCVAWRWKLRDHDARIVRTHGDFHPFNIVFAGDTDLTLLDASRGACGDPADDLTALTVNFVLFALGAPAAWPRGLGVLWHRCWQRYLALRPDRELLAVAPPFFAWRALVVANPRFYPNLGGVDRDRLLGLAERFLDGDRLEPAYAEELFA